MIEYFTFGKIVIDGIVYTEDIKIIQQRVISNWWRVTGHRVDIDDVADLLRAEPAYLVIGQGQPGQMQTSTSLQKYLTKAGVELFEAPTARAVEFFNRMIRENRPVCAGFHLTC